MKVNWKELREKSPHEYALLRASALQKFIRRSMTAEAIGIAQLFLDDGHKKGLIKRLKILATEDIGLANVKALNYSMVSEDPMKTVAVLCQTGKNRECDRFLLQVAYNLNHFRAAKPETLREVKFLNKLLKLSTLWFDNKRNKEAKKDLDNFVELLVSKNEERKEIIQNIYSNYLELSKTKTFGVRVLLAAIVLISLRKEVLSSDINESIPEGVLVEDIPDYIIDKHTVEGKRMGRGFEHWEANGAVVIPEVDYPELYEDSVEKYPLKPILKILDQIK